MKKYCFCEEDNVFSKVGNVTKNVKFDAVISNDFKESMKAKLDNSKTDQLYQSKIIGSMTSKNRNKKSSLNEKTVAPKTKKKSIMQEVLDGISKEQNNNKRKISSDSNAPPAKRKKPNEVNGATDNNKRNEKLDSLMSINDILLQIQGTEVKDIQESEIRDIYIGENSFSHNAETNNILLTIGSAVKRVFVGSTANYLKRYLDPAKSKVHIVASNVARII